MREQHQVELAPYTTMRVGGPAQRFVTATTIDDIVDAVCEVDDAEEPLLILAGGSNVFISDAGFEGTVVHIATEGIEVLSSTDQCVRIRVAAGEPWDALVQRSVAEGWSGLEALSGIPGAAGSTPIQNVGAYGHDVSQTVQSVRVYDREEQAVCTLSAEELQFGYRHSLLKSTQRYVVVDVDFELTIDPMSSSINYADLARGLGVDIGSTVPLAAAREGVLQQRMRRGMVLDPADHDTWSCGSFFTNPIVDTPTWQSILQRAQARGIAKSDVPQYPGGADGWVKTSAAWLIERAGFGKGFGMPGPAALSTKHTLAVTNRGAATAHDVAQLARTVRHGVKEAFGVRLVPEPVWVGHSIDDDAEVA